MKVAAVDIGSNSVHLVVSRLYAPGVREVLDRKKEMLQLGRTGFRRGEIPSGEMDRAISVLKRYRAIAESQGVEAVLAVATSAVRDARNRAVFLERAEHEARMAVRVLSEEEEGRLIYAGARDFVPPTLRRLGVIDIGGGSVEIVLGEGAEVRTVRSLRLGVLRLAQRFPEHKGRDLKRMEKVIRKELRAAARDIASAAPDAVLGTSGTILALASLLGVREEARPIRLGTLEALAKKLCSSSPKSLRELPAVGKGRADTIGPGALVLKVFMEEAGLDEVIPCERALRDGVVADYAMRSGARLSDQDEEILDPRRRSVHFLARRLGALDLHARHTARLSLRLFDELAPLHRLDAADRELLEYAALLHDAGYWISAQKHHKHAYYLIRQAPLEGFSRDEVRIIALTARYHRGVAPKGRHDAFGELSKKQRRRVRALSSILRIADGLDRSHAGLVEEMDVNLNGKVVTLGLTARGDLELELYAAERRAELFRSLYERDLRFKVIRKEDS